MRQTFDASDRSRGTPRMYRELRRIRLGINEKRVRRLMCLHDMAGAWQR